MTGEGLRYDPRVTAARRDLAALSLQGQIQAPAYSAGEPYTVLTETVDLKRAPRPDASVDTQLLYGETLVVYDDDNGWGWVQADRDRYVGYVAMSALGRAAISATHKVVVARTLVYPAADMKQPPYAAIPMDGRVCVEGVRGAFLKIRGHGFVYASHLAPLDASRRDPVDVALSLVGAPYLWGGRTYLGIDCSGLVQLAFSMAGLCLPRDTDMQERLGEDIPSRDAVTGALALQRGDLVFWRGHVALMIDATTIVHASGHQMLVCAENLDQAQKRNSNAGLEISSCKRMRAAM